MPFSVLESHNTFSCHISLGSSDVTRAVFLKVPFSWDLPFLQGLVTTNCLRRSSHETPSHLNLTCFPPLWTATEKWLTVFYLELVFVIFVPSYTFPVAASLQVSPTSLWDHEGWWLALVGRFSIKHVSSVNVKTLYIFVLYLSEQLKTGWKLQVFKSTSCLIGSSPVHVNTCGFVGHTRACSVLGQPSHTGHGRGK